MGARRRGFDSKAPRYWLSLGDLLSLEKHLRLPTANFATPTTYIELMGHGLLP